MENNHDIVIIGAGIVGLSIARELNKRYPKKKILIFEKELELGKHSSGRNSGVLHSGIYYQKGSLKAKVCTEGANELAAYCEEHKLPFNRVGKVIVPVRKNDNDQLDILYERAKNNKARVELIDNKQLKEIEPESYSITGKALYSPDTAVFDPKAILNYIAKELVDNGVKILYNSIINYIDTNTSCLMLNGQQINFGYLFNTAGIYADKIAKFFNAGERYAILPFKGLYYKLSPLSGLKINGHIYPVPDIEVPFLGVHFTKSITGDIYVGPTAIPAFGRESYKGLEDIKMKEATKIVFKLIQQYINNNQGFRNLVYQEGTRVIKSNFAKAAKSLVPKIKSKYLLSSDKVGIRPQLIDIHKKELVMDFIIEKVDNSIHILNAISPAFTSAFSFSRFVLDNYFKNVFNPLSLVR